MSKLITQEIGSIRKPEYLSSKFHKLSDSERSDKASKAAKEMIARFEDTGIDNIGIAGEMYRWEMYEHLAKYIEGIKFYGHVRSFDNRYYLKGSVSSELSLRESPHSEEFEFVLNNTSKGVKVPITGPYTMMDWSFNDHYEERYELAMAFARVLNVEIRNLKKVWQRSGRSGILEVQIDEPAGTTHKNESQILIDSVNESVKGISDCEFTIHVCYTSGYPDFFRSVPELKLHGLNLEFANRDSDELGTTDEARKGYTFLRNYVEALDTSDHKIFMGLGT
ncbi:MAG: uroporphyrinogen decarboxylase/cobalamine-independent methonine synthase family protein, partial [Thermoplasmataceae archaeon]